MCYRALLKAANDPSLFKIIRALLSHRMVSIAHAFTPIKQALSGVPLKVEQLGSSDLQYSCLLKPMGVNVEDDFSQLEMDIKLTKDLSLLLLAIHNPFFWRMLKKTILFSGFKNRYKKIRETRNLESIHE